MKIKSIITHNGDKINLGNFAVFVGPNNVGKSQTLRDIRNKLLHGPSHKSVILDKILLNEVDTFDELTEGMRVTEHPTNMELHRVSGIESSLTGGNQVDVNIKSLQEKLHVYSREAKRMEELYGTKFSGKVTIQGDKAVPYKLLVKVMATCGRSEYPNMRLVVYRQGE